MLIKPICLFTSAGVVAGHGGARPVLKISRHGESRAAEQALAAPIQQHNSRLGRRGFLNPLAPPGKERLIGPCRSFTADVKQVLIKGGVPPEVILQVYELMEEERQRLTVEMQKTSAEMHLKLFESQEKLVETTREVVEAKTEVAAAEKKLGEMALAEEIAKSRTMDLMREKCMVNARGILEVAEFFERPLHKCQDDSRVTLWRAILSERFRLAQCLQANAGWSLKQAPQEIDALYRNLNSRMH